MKFKGNTLLEERSLAVVWGGEGGSGGSEGSEGEGELGEVGGVVVDTGGRERGSAWGSREESREPGFGAPGSSPE